MAEIQKIKGLRDEREHLSLIFMGHVDAGKSTISGQILLSTGQVDKRTIEKYEKDAKAASRGSWYLAYIMDLTDEERSKGITQECGTATFETEKKRITLLDAPGHQTYVPAMLTGLAQADVAVLVVSARKNEFEAGFDGGQSIEHTVLARTFGINKLLVMVNKMDDSTVEWDQNRFNEIVDKLSPRLKSFGYNVKKDVIFFPASGYTGQGIKDPVPDVCSKWYKGKQLFSILDDLPPIVRYTDKPVRLPVASRIRDGAALNITGKLETGTLNVGDELICIPTGKKGTVLGIDIDSTYEVEKATPGENLLIHVKGLDEDDVYQGNVLCAANAAPSYKTDMLEVQLLVTDLPEGTHIMSLGFQCVLHAHTMTVQCSIQGILKELNKKGEVVKEKPNVLRQDSIGILRLKLSEPQAFEKFEEYPMLARFTLRSKNKTIGIGKVLRLKPL